MALMVTQTSLIRLALLRLPIITIRSENNRYTTLHIGASEIECKVVTPQCLRCLANSFT